MIEDEEEDENPVEKKNLNKLKPIESKPLEKNGSQPKPLNVKANSNVKPTFSSENKTVPVKKISIDNKPQISEITVIND